MSDAPSEMPGSVLFTPKGDSFFVHETPDLVRQKIEEVRDGTADNHDGSVIFVGLEVESRGEEFRITPYQLCINPLWIVTFREMTKPLWDHHMQMHMAPQQSGGPVADILGAVFGAQALGGEGEPEKPGGPGAPMLTSRAVPTEVCCCSHPASSHDQTTEFVGPCLEESCNCSLFHQHPEGSNGH